MSEVVTEKYRVAIVMPTYNRRAQTMICVRAAYEAAVADSNACLVVVDNGSTDGTWEEICSLYSGMIVLDCIAEVNISVLRNRGAELAIADILCFVDSDCIVPIDYVDRVRKVMKATQSTAAGSQYGLPQNVHWIEKTWMRLNCPPRNGPTNALPGGSMSILASAFRQVGGFDSSLITGEDADLCERLLVNGASIVESQELMVTHLRNMNSLRMFYRKQRWHSLGSGKLSRNRLIDKISIAAMCHAILTIVALLVLLWIQPPLSIPIALLLFLLTPILMVAYRVISRGGSPVLVRGTLLYTVYFCARVIGMLTALLGCLRAPNDGLTSNAS